MEAAKSRSGAVPDALDRAVGGTNLGVDRPPRWWALVGAVQWVLLAAAVVGGASLGVIAVLAYLQIDVDVPSLGRFAWPTVLLVGGLALGLVLRVVVRPFVAFGAARRRRRAASGLRWRVDTVGEEFVLAPLRAELSAYEQLLVGVDRLGR